MRSWISWLVTVICVVVIGQLATPAAALVVNADGHPFTSATHRNAILDTSTNLLWLDATETSSRSFNDVQARLGAGAEFAGWQVASRMQIRQLYQDAGLRLTDNWVNDSALRTAVQSFQSIYGTNQTWMGSGGATYAACNVYYDQSFVVNKMETTAHNTAGNTTFLAFVGDGAFSLGSRSPTVARADVGTALVRVLTPQLTTSLANGSTADFGNILVGNSRGATITVSSTGDPSSTLHGTIQSVGGEFSPGTTQDFSLAQGTSVTRTYSYTPLTRGADAQGLTVTSDGGTSTITLSGKGVAPVNQVTMAGDAGLTRIGTSTTAEIQIRNVGDGNLSGLGETSNLRGTTALNGSSNFTGSTPNISLADGAISVLSYGYTPQGHSAETASLQLGFLNGNQLGTNQAENVELLLGGQGVGPVFTSKLDGISLAPGSTIEFGRVGSGQIASRLLQFYNTTTDPGDQPLTGLTLLGVAFGGADASIFSLRDFAPGCVINKDFWEQFAIDCAATGDLGRKTATLTLYTDEGAAFGSYGDAFVFNLEATVVPEPSTLIIWSLLGSVALGLGWWRKRGGA